MDEAAAKERKRLVDEPVPMEQIQAEIEELNDLSNRAGELTRQGNLEEAERIGHELLKRFPDQMDGIERLADVYAARGESAKAAQYYRKAAYFAEHGKDYDPELIAYLKERASEQEERARSKPEGN
jgi:tetratricopeptide (TPR) repeat protein